MARTDPQVNLRIPAELKARIDQAAEDSGRSMNAEVVARLQASFDGFYQSMAFDEVRDYAVKNNISLQAALTALVAAGSSAPPVYYIEVHPGVGSKDLGSIIRKLGESCPPDASVFMEKIDSDRSNNIG